MVAPGVSPLPGRGSGPIAVSMPSLARSGAASGWSKRAMMERAPTPAAPVGAQSLFDLGHGGAERLEERGGHLLRR